MYQKKQRRGRFENGLQRNNAKWKGICKMFGFLFDIVTLPFRLVFGLIGGIFGLVTGLVGGAIGIVFGVLGVVLGLGIPLLILWGIFSLFRRVI